MNERVLEYGEALAEVLQHAAGAGRVAEQETLALLEAAGRVLARGIRADRDQPPFARSTRDGYAVRSTDVSAEQPLRIVGGIRAGERWAGAALGDCQALEIMTGAPLPQGADAVLMVEHGSVGQDGQLSVAAGRTLDSGENVVAQGAEAHAGAELVPAGRRVGPAEIALAASCGCAELEVYRRPRVAIVATGDELVEVDAEPEACQIRNSNSYALAALIAMEGGEPWRLAVARDTMEDLRERIAEAGEADLLLLSGGVSMGKYDLVERALREAGAEFVFTGAWIQPGKPVVFGRLPRKERASQWMYFFGLPGNPVSTEVCFRLFAAPMLRALGGQSEVAPRFVEALLAENVKGGAGRSKAVTRFLPALMESDWRQASVRVVPWQGSGDLAANARANGFVVLPGGVEQFVAGESLTVLLR